MVKDLTRFLFRIIHNTNKLRQMTKDVLVGVKRTETSDNMEIKSPIKNIFQLTVSEKYFFVSK